MRHVQPAAAGTLTADARSAAGGAAAPSRTVAPVVMRAAPAPPRPLLPPPSFEEHGDAPGAAARGDDAGMRVEGVDEGADLRVDGALWGCVCVDGGGLGEGGEDGGFAGKEDGVFGGRRGHCAGGWEEGVRGERTRAAASAVEEEVGCLRMRYGA